jgi:hypothetical protein
MWYNSVVETERNVNGRVTMMSAAIAFRIRPARAGLGPSAIIALRLPAWPKLCAQDEYRRQKLAKELDHERSGDRNLVVLSLPLTNGY